MTILPIVALSAVVLWIAYRTYGRLVVRWLGVDPNRPTPAVQREDGNDFVPAPAPVVLGGHFTAIAAAGPVVGPILAGLAFGWGPALLWILLGSIFIGAVHDAGSLMASIRHNATSITQVVRQHMSRTAYITFLIFVWICLVYVVIAFADVTASTFSQFTSVTVGERMIDLNGGAVVIGATGYLLFSIVMGLILRFTRTPWWIALIGAVVLLGVCIANAPAWAAWLAAHGLSFMDTAGKDPGFLTRHWDQALLIYCFIASVAPMWLLLQPRGVIGATFLYAALAAGIVGTLAGGWSSGGPLAIHWPMFRSFTAADGAMLFPFLFITIACGACSGFHSVVSSGTTCKQLRSEKDVRPVAYGAMLLEAMVAVLALACLMMLRPGEKLGSPDLIYALGIGKFMNLLGIPLHFAVAFGLLAFSSFVFDTLDVCTRLGRYVMQEMLGVRGLWGGALATLITLAAPSVYLWSSPPGSFKTFWVLFGTSNQLLAALTLVGVSVWLWRTGRPALFAALPAAFMLANTAAALILNFRAFFSKYQLLRGLAPEKLTPAAGRELSSLPINMALAAVLFGLAVLVVIEAMRVWWRGARETAPLTTRTSPHTLSS